jgi:meso-butanediol dehydrogenase / (S,S)-butanediol dehydrogenase / diacetyl reductase
MSSGVLAGKQIVVTGGASGIGRACALKYAQEGARVALLDVDDDALRRTCSELAIDGVALRCDVSSGPAVEEAIEQAANLFGGLDCIHNNAGISSPSRPLHKTTETEWDRLHQINLKSVYWTTRFGIKHLMKSNGSILNTASMVGLIGQSDHAAYVATKGAMIALTKAMALDYAPLKIRVNAICPAGVWTPLLRRWASEQSNSTETERYLDCIHALGYCPEPDVIADASAFLLSEQARFITGCTLPVSGGAELGYRR